MCAAQKEVIERLKLDVSGIRDQLELAEASQSHIILKKMAQHLDSRCVLLSDPSTFGALVVPTKTRLDSSIKRFNPHSFMFACVGPAEGWFAVGFNAQVRA